MNRTIINPFMFQFDEKNQWSPIYDVKNVGLIEWLVLNSRYVNSFSYDNLQNGFFETKIFGQANIRNVSFEILIKSFKDLKKNKDFSCITSDMMGIPYDFLYIRNKDEEILLLDPLIIEKSWNNKKYKIKVGEDTPIMIEVPDNILVSFFDYKLQKTETKSLIAPFSVCSWQFNNKQLTF